MKSHRLSLQLIYRLAALKSLKYDVPSWLKYSINIDVMVRYKAQYECCAVSRYRVSGHRIPK